MQRRLQVAQTALLAILLCLAAVADNAAGEEFRVPKLSAAVTDRADMLSPAARANLETALRQLQKQGGTQLAVLTLPDLGGLSIEQASIQIVDQWKLGGEAEDNGVLLLIAREELFRLSKNVYLSREWLIKAEDLVVATIEDKGVLDSGEFKHHIGSSRKYALAILDFLDTRMVTTRMGNNRRLTRNYRNNMLPR